MSIDFSSMTPKALQKLIAEATREQKRKKKRAPIAQVRAKLTRTARTEGYTIAELFGGAAPAATAATKTPRRRATKLTTTRKVAPKYRNPANHEQTWTGRGKAPLWFNALIESGRTREELLIPVQAG
ncbi:MAG TPA: H-NS histone family protein [Chiayiivirga sp.]|nr:H-NS histone family protein [Chiayiivirga sp.]